MGSENNVDHALERTVLDSLHDSKFGYLLHPLSIVVLGLVLLGVVYFLYRFIIFLYSEYQDRKIDP